MPHPLEQELRRLGRRARCYVVLQAVARAFCLLAAVASLLVLADFLIHFQDRGLRAIQSLVLLVALAVGARWIVRAIVGSRYRLVQLARHAEQLFPQLRGNLASAVEFLNEREDDPRAGSAELRRAVVSQATAQVERLDLSATVDARPTRKLLAWSGVALVGIAALALMAGPAARIAVVRLLNPLNDVEWPRDNQLAISNPVERLPAGQTFEVEVIDAAGAALPGDVAMHYRFETPEGGTSEEIEPMLLVNGHLLARRENVGRPFEYRAMGGDDRRMPWRQLEIVEPPEVRQATVRLRSPAYTGWPERAAELHFRALHGTQVVVEARSTKPLSTAAVRFVDDGRVSATVSEDGYRLKLPGDSEPPWHVDHSGTYWFELTDREGFASAALPKYELHAVADAPPTVDVEQPKSNVFVTAEATLPLVIVARDDLAIHEVVLHYLRSDQSDRGEQTVVLDARPDQVPAELAAASAAEGFAGDRRDITYAWELKPLALPPGTQITFHVAAADYSPQVGQSFPRRITILTPEELQDRLAEQQTVIFNELARVLELQRNTRSHVTGLEVQLELAGALKQGDIDTLQGAGLNQQQVERELTSETDGVRGQILDFLDQLQINKVDGPDTQRQMQNVLDELSRLGDRALPDAARELTSAAKAAQTSNASVRASLKSAGQSQDEVIRSIERLSADMQQWVNYRQFHREIGQLEQAQQETTTATAALAQQTMTRAFADLDPQQRADLQKLAQREFDLARRLERLEQQMESTAAAAREEDPLVADTVADALAHARRQGTAEAMRQAGQGTEQNKLGQAAGHQRQVQDDLHELLDILSNRREHELERLVKKLRAAEEKLTQLTQEHEGLRKKLAAEAAQSTSATPPAQDEQKAALERLSRQEQQLREETKRFGRTLERLQADKASQTAAQAGGKMDQAGKKAGEGAAGAAAEQADAAQKDLEEAQQQLAEQRRQAEVDLAQEQLARMEDAITSLHTRQEKLITETKHYEQRRAAQGRWTRAEGASVRELARQELALRDESAGLAKTLAGAEVFQFVLEGVGRDMGLAGERLDRRETDDETVRIETSAVTQLAQLLAALQPEPAKPQEPKSGGGSSGGPASENNARTRSVSELKLLKLMQQRINERTVALEQARRQSAQLTEVQEREYAALAQDQGRLAELVANMLQVLDPPPEEDPDQLPRIDPESRDGADAKLKDLPGEPTEKMP